MVNGLVVERMVQFTGQAKDLGGGVKVRRLLPAAQRQGIGPFLFLDHFGPFEIRPREVIDVHAPMQAAVRILMPEERTEHAARPSGIEQRSRNVQ